MNKRLIKALGISFTVALPALAATAMMHYATTSVASSATAGASTAVAASLEDPEQPENTTVSVNLETAGSLGVEVLYLVDELSDVTDLKVTGPLNSVDWTTLKNMTSLVNADLSGATATEVPARNFENRTSLTSILLPQGLTSIQSNAFRNTGLTTIEIPETVTSIDSDCFRECNNLISANIKCNATGYQMFYNCYNLEQVTVAKELKVIAGRVFFNCTALKSVNLPNTLVTIESEAFRGTKNLTDIIFPESLRSIMSNAFLGSGITKAILPEKLEELQSGAFSSCSSLKEVTLQATPFTLGSTFSSCTALEKITFRTATPPAVSSSDPFSYVNKSQITLVVPSFSVVNYKLDSYWIQFGAITSGVDGDYWAINSELSLTNNRRMEGTPSIRLMQGSKLSVGGNAPMPIDELTLENDIYNKNFAQVINNSPEMTANSVKLSLYTYNNGYWYFVSFPCDVNLSDITHSEDCDYVFRYYDGESRATNGTGSSWKNVPADGVLEAGKGYIYQAYKAGNLNINLTPDAAALLAAGNRATPVKAYPSENEANAGWNLIGNPYMAYFDLAKTSLMCPVTVWETNKYVAYSLIDDDVILKPFQAFFIQQTESDDEVVFDALGRQFTTEVARAMKAPGISSARTLYNLSLENAGKNLSDRTRIVINPEASLEYEISCDASKFFADSNEIPALYTIDAHGNRLAINERPYDGNAVALGFYAPAAGEWTLTLASASSATLYDSATGKEIELTPDSSYTFSVDAPGYDDNRFTILTGNVSTGIESVAAESVLALTIEGNTVTVSGECEGSVNIFSIDGRLVESSESARTFTLPRGMYVVVAGKKTAKCVVK